ncbi:MAG: response regulator [candidate division Zixibacteria bacterium]
MDKKTVLVVDDEEIIRDFLFEVLNDDFEVSTASDGDEAIDKLKEQSYDLVITDLKMPRVSGDEVVRFAKQSDPEAKVIVITGYSSLYSVSKSANHGANAFLSKPFSIKELMQTVSDCLG